MTNHMPLRGNLLWQDEFDYEGLLDNDKWLYGIGFKQNELQYYTEVNSFVKENCLVIETRRENYKSFEFTSARLQSKKAFRYGVFEIRAKVSKCMGIKNSIWLRSTKRPYRWPGCGEIDIFEHDGANPGIIRSSIQCKTHNTKREKEQQEFDEIYLGAVCEDFQIFAIDWNEKRIKFFLNGCEYFSYYKYEESADSWPFDDEFNIVISTSVSNKVNTRRILKTNETMSDDIFPNHFSIDYIRQYESVDVEIECGHCSLM